MLLYFCLSANNCSAIDRVCKTRYIQDDYARVLFVMELIMLKRDILYSSDEFFSVHGIRTVINFVCSFNLFFYNILCTDE